MERPADRVAFAFPGVAVRLCGAETGVLRAREALFRPLLDEASDVAGRDLTAALRSGTVDALADREKQAFTYAFSVGVARAFAETGVAPDLFAGYSFGVYAALAFSGAVSFTDGLAMLAEAYDVMERATAGRDAGMAVVIGLTEAEVRASLGDRNGTATLVNSNSDVCHVVAGLAPDLAAFVADARARGAVSAEALGVRIPYHHPVLLADAVPAFRRFLAGRTWNDPTCPLVSSIDQSLLATAAELTEFAARNLATPISWRRVALRLAREGVARIVECGPGISLTQNGRFLPAGITYLNVRRLAREEAE
jgi:[acyl-carrier-protein] S-malonyltransferase